jgi:predicted MFS family arabinose efflux permease
MPFGAVVGGVLANEFGVRSAIFVSGSVLVLVGLLLPLVLRGVDRYDRSARSTT